jgi:hypothetical protein
MQRQFHGICPSVLRDEQLLKRREWDLCTLEVEDLFLGVRLAVAFYAEY